jgi:hypothetical protein
MLQTARRCVLRGGMLCSVLALLVFVTGCPQTTPCTADADCDNDTFCDGAETCVDMVCTDGAAPCAAGETCNEDADRCDVCDADADCDDGLFCNGDETCSNGQCADGANPCDDDGVFCNGAESCDETADACDSSGDPCDPVTEQCNETTDACDTVCASDGECDDGLFCNGAETCGADNLCDAGTNPCPDDGTFCNGTESCSEATDACVSSGDPCSDPTPNCNEGTNMCESGVACTTDADCADDGTFCNGTESCGANNFCGSSGDPCVAPEMCDEALNACVEEVGDTFDFTLGTDALSGSGGADTFRANLLFNAPTGTNVPSLQTGDSALGGDATDVLNPAQFNFGAATTVSPTLSGIETISVTDFGTAATTLAGVGITGATTFNFVNSTNANAFTVTNLPTLANVGITNQAVGATLTFATAATNGAADAATMTFNGMTAGTLTYTTGTTNGLETLNIVSNTNASTVADIAMNGTTLTTVNASGGANFTHTASLDANVATLDASGATGDTTFTQTNAGAFTYTGGGGNDTIILGGTFGTTDTLNGGAGSDTLGGTSAVLAGTTSNQTNVTNFEGLRVSNELAGAVNPTHFGSIVSLTLDDGSNGGSVTDASNGFAVANGLSGGAVCVGTSTFALTVSGAATTDAVTYTLNDCEQAGNVTFTGVETLNLVSNLDLDGSAADSGTAGQNTLTGTLVLTPGPGATQEVVLITGSEQLNINGAITADVIDGSGSTQPFVMGVATTTSSVTVRGGSGADTLFGSSGNDTIEGGDGADIIDAEDGDDSISGGAGADTFRFTTGDLSAAPSASVFDTITDFGVNSDIFDDTVNALSIVSGSTAAAGTAAINGEGICTFNAADDTLAERIVAAEAGINASGVAAAGQIAVFEHSTNSYLFVSDGVDGVGAADVLFQLTGVTGLSDTTITGGNLTIQ